MNTNASPSPNGFHAPGTNGTANRIAHHLPSATPATPSKGGNAQARMQVELALYRLLAELPPNTSLAVEVKANGVAAIVRIGPENAMPKLARHQELDAREQEVFDVTVSEIGRLGRRVVGAEIRAAMKAAGIRWGVSTVANTLSRLVEKRWLVNDKDKLGYGIGEQAAK
jgi:hypothetical protein